MFLPMIDLTMCIMHTHISVRPCGVRVMFEGPVSHSTHANFTKLCTSKVHTLLEANRVEVGVYLFLVMRSQIEVLRNEIGYFWVVFYDFLVAKRFGPTFSLKMEDLAEGRECSIFFELNIQHHFSPKMIPHVGDLARAYVCLQHSPPPTAPICGLQQPICGLITHFPVCFRVKSSLKSECSCYFSHKMCCTHSNTHISV